MPSTYDLLTEASALLDAIVSATDDEQDALLANWYDNWQGDAAAKVDALRAVASRAQAEEGFLKEEASRLTARARACSGVHERVRGYATQLLEAHERVAGEPKLKTPTCTAWLQETQRVEGPEDPYQWPEELRVVDVRPDRATALRRLKAGETIPGLRLEASRSVRWR